jgi:hypothetical protein
MGNRLPAARSHHAGKGGPRRRGGGVGWWRMSRSCSGGGGSAVEWRRRLLRSSGVAREQGGGGDGGLELVPTGIAPELVTAGNLMRTPPRRPEYIFFCLRGEKEWIFSSPLSSDVKSIVLLRRLLKTIRRYTVPLLNAFLQMPTIVGVSLARLLSVFVLTSRKYSGILIRKP